MKECTYKYITYNSSDDSTVYRTACDNIVDVLDERDLIGFCIHCGKPINIDY